MSKMADAALVLVERPGMEVRHSLEGERHHHGRQKDGQKPAGCRVPPMQGSIPQFQWYLDVALHAIVAIHFRAKLETSAGRQPPPCRAVAGPQAKEGHAPPPFPPSLGMVRP